MFLVLSYLIIRYVGFCNFFSKFKRGMELDILKNNFNRYKEF